MPKTNSPNAHKTSELLGDLREQIESHLLHVQQDVDSVDNWITTVFHALDLLTELTDLQRHFASELRDAFGGGVALDFGESTPSPP